MPRTLHALAALLVGALLMGACAPGATTPTTSAAPAPAELIVDYGVNAVGSLDPLKWRSTAEKQALRLAYESLTTYDGKTELQPQLATSWSVSEDKLTWTFKLRPNVKFHDGSALDATAVKFNFDRMIDPQSVSLNAPTFRTVIKSVTAVDAQTVQVTTNGPQSSLPGMLAGWGGEIVNPVAVVKVDNDPTAAAKLGTGTYSIAVFQPGTAVTFKRNDAYWGTKANFERITLKSIPEVSARVAALTSGQTHVALSVPATQLSLLQQDAKLRVITTDTTLMWYLGFNTRKPPLNDKRVRQAIAYAVNMPEVASTVYGGKLKLFPGPVPSSLQAYDASLKGYTRDLAKAKSLLGEAGATNLNLELLYSDSPDLDRFAQLMQAQLKEAGINLTVRKLEYATYYAALTKGEMQIFIQGWGNSTGQAVYTLQSLYGSRAPASVNLSGFGDAQVDAYFRDALASFDPSTAKQAISNAQKIIIEAAATPYAWSLEPIHAMAKDLSNWTPTPIGDLTTIGLATWGK